MLVGRGWGWGEWRLNDVLLAEVILQTPSPQVMHHGFSQELGRVSAAPFYSFFRSSFVAPNQPVYRGAN